MDKDVEQRFHGVDGEALATQTILIELLRGLIQSDQANIELVKGALNRAKDLLTDLAMIRGDKNPAIHTTQALQTVAQLRSILQL